MNSVNLFTGLYLCPFERLMVPPLVTLNQSGFGIRFAAWGLGNRSGKPWWSGRNGILSVAINSR